MQSPAFDGDLLGPVGAEADLLAAAGEGGAAIRVPGGERMIPYKHTVIFLIRAALGRNIKRITLIMKRS